MKLYAFTYKRDAHEVIYIKAENAIDAKKMADREAEQIDWDKAYYDVTLSWYTDDPNHLNLNHYQKCQSEKVRSKLHGFN